ncbi:hypothetical protein HanOQP8_Chr12g0448011 [Helianthus annuus]|nr:hypothetical protein HanOQP8_Chr12g0448011 [Helianthus annuus]
MLQFLLLGFFGVTMAQNLAFVGLTYSSPIVAIGMTCLIPSISFILAVLCRLVYVLLFNLNLRMKIICNALVSNHTLLEQELYGK